MKLSGLRGNTWVKIFRLFVLVTDRKYTQTSSSNYTIQLWMNRSFLRVIVPVWFKLNYKKQSRISIDKSSSIEIHLELRATKCFVRSANYGNIAEIERQWNFLAVRNCKQYVVHRSQNVVSNLLLKGRENYGENKQSGRLVNVLSDS